MIEVKKERQVHMHFLVCIPMLAISSAYCRVRVHSCECVNDGECLLLSTNTSEVKRPKDSLYYPPTIPSLDWDSVSSPRMKLSKDLDSQQIVQALIYCQVRTLFSKI